MPNNSFPLVLLHMLSLCPCLLGADFYVDGKVGQDLPGNGSTSSQPWKTLSYALANLPQGSHILHVAGGQIYSAATNGETFPLVPPPGTEVRGEGAARPILQVPAGKIGIQLAVAAGTGRVDVVRNLVVQSGSAGLSLNVNAGGNFFCTLQLTNCEFSNQSNAGVSLAHTQGSGQAVATVTACSFRQSPTGIDVTSPVYGFNPQLIVSECVFQSMSVWGISVVSGHRDNANAPQVSKSLFRDCTGGIRLQNGYSSPNSPVRVTQCQFLRCPVACISVDAGIDNLNGLAFSGCIFSDSGDALLLTLSGSTFFGTRTTTISNCFTTSCRRGLGITYGGQGGIADTFTLTDNWYEKTSIAQSVYNNGSSGLAYSSLRERLDRCGLGILLQAGVAPSTAQIDSAMITRSTGYGAYPGAGAVNFEMSGSFRCSGLTLADNLIPAVRIVRADSASTITHSAFSNNSVDLQRLVTFPATYCCFQGMSDAGTGNLNLTDPMLTRPLYKLASSSPCLDAGSSAVQLGPTDYEGDARTIGARPDIGADEYTPAGTVRRYGLAGFGTLGFAPRIDSPNTSLKIGTSLTVLLSGAMDSSSVPATSASLIFGADEFLGSLPRTFDWLGAPTSLLLLEPILITAPRTVSATGTSSELVPIPVQSALLGYAATVQWIVLKANANAGGFVTTQGMRATIGT